MTDIARRGTVAALLALAVICPTRPASAAQPPRQATPAVARQTEPAAAPRPALPPQQAEEIRAALSQVLARYSPSVGRVLALAPSLLTQQGYLDPYPEIVAFLREHPEIVRDPAYYFPRRSGGGGLVLALVAAGHPGVRGIPRRARDRCPHRVVVRRIQRWREI